MLILLPGCNTTKNLYVLPVLPPHPEKGLLRPLVVDEKGLDMLARPEGALCVGSRVSVWVGSRVGVRVGSRVGVLVGSLVGRFEGALSVGIRVGIPTGNFAMGVIVVFFVANVGAGVGATVHFSVAAIKPPPHSQQA